MDMFAHSMDAEADAVFEVGPLDIAIAVVEYMLTVVMVFTNLLVIIAVRRFPRLHTPTNYLVLNLAVADLLVGVTLPYLAAFHIVPKLNHMKYACLLRYFIISGSCLESSWTLVLISADRFLAIEYPLKHRAYVKNKKTIGIAVAVSWTYTALFSLSPMMGWNAWDREPSICTYADLMDPVFTLVLVGHFVVKIILMAVLYGHIFCTVRRHTESRRQKAEQLTTVDQNTTYNTGSSVNKAGLGISKATKVLLLVLGVYLLTWTPFSLVITTQAVMALNGNPDFNQQSLRYAEVITGLIGISNSVWNFMIYAWKNSQYRQAFRKILHLKSSSDLNQASLHNICASSHM